VGARTTVTPIMLAVYTVTALPASVAQVIVFRKFGLLAPVALRLGEWAIWHIPYGNLL